MNLFLWLFGLCCGIAGAILVFVGGSWALNLYQMAFIALVVSDIIRMKKYGGKR